MGVSREGKRSHQKPREKQSNTTNPVSDLMHSQYRLSGPPRKRPTRILRATCGSFHVVILQEADENVPHVTDQFHTDNSDNSDLAILLNKDTFEPGAVFISHHRVLRDSRDSRGDSSDSRESRGDSRHTVLIKTLRLLLTRSDVRL